MADYRPDLPPGLPVDPEPEQDAPAPPPAPEPERRVVIGRIVKPHGLSGDLKVAPETWRPQRFADLEHVWCEGPDGRVHWLTIKRLRSEPGGLFIRFAEAATRTYAEPLVGGVLFIDEADRDELPEDLYYIDDLVGCTVVDSQHGELGRIREVMDLPANDVWEVDGPFGEVLVPALKHVVTRIDLEAKRIDVDLPEGLLPDPEADRKDPERTGASRPSTRSRHRRR